MKLLKIIKKNFKVLFRSKFASFIVIFGPLLVILLIGFAFENFNSYKINVGVFSETYSDLSKSYIVEMSDSSNFQVIKYLTKEECINEIKFGGIHTCLIFPNDFSLSTENNTLNFHVDPSNINLVWMVIDEVSKKIDSSSSKVSLNLTQDIMSRISYSKNKTAQINQILNSFESEIDDTVQLVDMSIDDVSDLKFEVSDVSTSSLSTSSAQSEITSLYSKADSAADDTLDLISDIQDSDTWSQLNSTQENELDNLLDSAQSAADTIKVTIQKDYNDSINALSSLTQNIASLGDDLASIQNMIESVQLTRDDVLDNLDALNLKLTDFSNLVSNIKQNSNEIQTSLSGIQITNAKSIVSPISTQIIPVTDEGEQHVNYLFPALLVLIIMFISLLLSSLNIVMEKNSRAYFRNFVTPTSDGVFLFGAIITNFIILIVELLLILLVTYLAFDSSIFNNIGVTSIILLLSCSFFILLGMIIGYLFSSEEGAILGTISISSILFFISNLVLPVDALPNSIKFFVNLNPFIITSNLLKRSLLFHVSLAELSSKLIFFSYYVLGAMILLFLVQKLTKLKFVYHNNLKNKKVTDDTKKEKELLNKKSKKQKKDNKKTNKNESKEDTKK